MINMLNMLENQKYNCVTYRTYRSVNNVWVLEQAIEYSELYGIYNPEGIANEQRGYGDQT